MVVQAERARSQRSLSQHIDCRGLFDLMRHRKERKESRNSYIEIIIIIIIEHVLCIQVNYIHNNIHDNNNENNMGKKRNSEIR